MLKVLNPFDYRKSMKINSKHVFLFSVRWWHDMVKSLFNISFP